MHLGDFKCRQHDDPSESWLPEICDTVLLYSLAVVAGEKKPCWAGFGCNTVNAYSLS